MRDFRIGPFRFQWLADGDDDHVGRMRVTGPFGMVEWQASRDEWDEFAEEAGP